MFKRSVITTFAALLILLSNAQTPSSIPDPNKAPCADVKTSRPSIMVIPRVKEGQDIRKAIDDDFNIRIAIGKVQEAFNNRGFTTYDFVAKLKAAMEEGVFTMENQSDYKTQLLQYASPDIYAEVEYEATVQGTTTVTKLILTGYDNYTAASLGTKPGSRGSNMNDPGLMIEGILNDGLADDFLNTMQTKFTEMIEDGRQVVVTFSLADGAMIGSFEDGVAAKGDEELQTVIEDWVAERAVKGNYHTPRVVARKMIFEDIRIPLRDPVTCKNYTVTNFGKAIIDFLKKDCQLNASRDVSGARITVTIK